MKRKNSGGIYRREKMVLLASSILVLAAMTVTGIYLENAKKAEQPENKVVDFSALEGGTSGENGQAAQVENNSARNLTSRSKETGEMDYDPYYVEKDRLLNGQYGENGAADGRESIQNGERIQQTEAAVPETAGNWSAQVGYSEMHREESGAVAVNWPDEAESPGTPDQAAADGGEAVAADTAAAPEAALKAVADVAREERNLHFSKEDVLVWPVAGNVLLNFSMDKTIYFQTLQQYKYNPSIVIAAAQGMQVACAADGIVDAVYEDAQTGMTVVMKLGNGYELTYGQLSEIAVEEGDFVETGVFIGKVSAPTKYYAQEGTNVYFKLTKDGKPVNPLHYLG